MGRYIYLENLASYLSVISHFTVPNQGGVQIVRGGKNLENVIRGGSKYAGVGIEKFTFKNKV